MRSGVVILDDKCFCMLNKRHHLVIRIRCNEDDAVVFGQRRLRLEVLRIFDDIDGAGDLGALLVGSGLAVAVHDGLAEGLDLDGVGRTAHADRRTTRHNDEVTAAEERALLGGFETDLEHLIGRGDLRNEDRINAPAKVQLALHTREEGAGHDRAGRTETGDLTGSSSAVGNCNDRLCIQVHRGRAAGVRDRVCDRRHHVRLTLAELIPVIDRRLGLLRDLDHHFQRLDRILAVRGLAT